MLIGNKVKALREAKKMSLTELSNITGIQLATLSRIENHKMTGTLESHLKIAKALGITITQLYSDIDLEEKRVDFQEQSGDADVFFHSDKASYEILTRKILTKKMMPTLIKIEPGGKTSLEQNKPGTEKFLFVLEGEVKVKVDQDIYSLSKHNTLYFDASLPHHLENSSDSLARVIGVVTPVSL